MKKRTFIGDLVLIINVLTLLFFLLPLNSCQNEKDSFDSNSNLSNVYGTLTVETFYGPPGYGEDPLNDSKEQHSILVLEEEPLGDTAKIQVVYLGDEDISNLTNKKVRVIGTFFSSHTGHHNTPILIEARQILLAK